MGIDESEVTRLLRGDVPNDDPVLGEVSSFLERVETAYPTVSTIASEGRHLAAVARESRMVNAELRHPRQSAVKRMFHGTHRILAGSFGALLIVLSAGAGIASALGFNPLDQLMSRLPISAPAAPPAATPTTDGTDNPAGNPDELGTATPPALPSSTQGTSPTAAEPADDPTAEAGQDKEAEKAKTKAENDAAKATAKARNEADKAAKEAEKAAAKAEKEAEKAAAKAEKEAGKASAKPTPSPTPTPSKDHGKKGEDDGSAETAG